MKEKCHSLPKFSQREDPPRDVGNMRDGFIRRGFWGTPKQSRYVPLIFGSTSSTNRIFAEAYSTPTPVPTTRTTSEIPRHHIAVDNDLCSVALRVRTGALTDASLHDPPAPERRVASPDVMPTLRTTR